MKIKNYLILANLTTYLLISQSAFAINLLRSKLYFDCENIKNPSDKLGGFLEWDSEKNMSYVDLFRGSKKLYRLDAIPKTDDSSRITEWNNLSSTDESDSVKLVYDFLLGQMVAHLEITHAKIIIDKYECPK